MIQLPLKTGFKKHRPEKRFLNLLKDAIAKKYPESTLKSASLSLKEEGVKAYRIIYVTKEGVENSILINIKTAPAKTAPATK